MAFAHGQAFSVTHFYQIGINNVNPTLEICLVGVNNGESDFYLSGDFWSSSAVHHDKDGRKIKIPVKAFNQEIKRINPTFLIVDVEGGEYELLQYADFYNVKKLLIEVHPHILGWEKINLIKKKLADVGFLINEQVSGSQEFFLERSSNSPNIG
jgi:hypothetical protein